MYSIQEDCTLNDCNRIWTKCSWCCFNLTTNTYYTYTKTIVINRMNSIDSTDDEVKANVSPSDDDDDTGKIKLKLQGYYCSCTQPNNLRGANVIRRYPRRTTFAQSVNPVVPWETSREAGCRWSSLRFSTPRIYAPATGSLFVSQRRMPPATPVVSPRISTVGISLVSHEHTASERPVPFS